MCTVSFLGTGGAVIITSNRDENIQRQNAAAPDIQQLPNKKIIFPRDSKAGGTWFAADDKGNVSVLLNGAFNKHLANPPYRKSRGLILVEIIASDMPLLCFNAIDLNNIEPFTIILYQPGSLHELRWDGIDKYEKLLDISGNYIWSSATLYSHTVIAERENSFKQLIQAQAACTAEGIHDFHSNNDGDLENGFVISRQNGMKTFSITQVVVKSEAVNFLHHDLLQQKIFKQSLPIIKQS
jgi:uncharacterized protein with NRDE domain